MICNLGCFCCLGCIYVGLSVDWELNHTFDDVDLSYVGVGRSLPSASERLELPIHSGRGATRFEVRKVPQNTRQLVIRHP